MLTFGHPLGVRYAGVVEVGVEHDDAERQDKRRVRVRENRPVLPDSIRSVRETNGINERKGRTTEAGRTIAEGEDAGGGAVEKRKHSPSRGHKNDVKRSLSFDHHR